MYNRLYQDLQNQDILYPKVFIFQKGNSTDHALIKLVDQIDKMFLKINTHFRFYILLKKLLCYCIKENDQLSPVSFLSMWKN